MTPNNSTWAVFTAAGKPVIINTLQFAYAEAASKGTTIYLSGIDESIEVEEDMHAVLDGVFSPLDKTTLLSRLGSFSGVRKAG